jgi:nucleoid-associated protein YgaU
MVPPTTPEPSKPLTIEYTKPAALPEAKPAAQPERIATTTFDVDLYEPTKTDTYATISKEFYNDAKYGAALSEYNGRRALQGGVRVEVPPIHVLKRRYPQLIGAVVPASVSVPAKDPWGPSTEGTPVKAAPPRTFTVPSGGLRMAEIAREVLGSPTRWSDLYDANPQLSPSDLLPAGTVVKIPTELKNR